MLSAPGKRVRETSNEVQPLSAPLTASPAPRCNTSHDVEAANQRVPIALPVDIRRGVEADPLT